MEPRTRTMRRGGSGPRALLVALLGLSACGGDPPEWSAPPTASLPAAAPAPVSSAPVTPELLAELDPAAAARVAEAAAAVDADPERAGPWSELGVVLHAHRRFELARACYEERLRRDPGDARTWYWLALVDDQLGDTERALRHLEACRRLEPRYPPAHWRAGLLRLARGELEPAEEALRAALELAPRDAAANVGLARVHLQAGRAPDAVALLEGHLERLPDDGNARYLLGTAYRAAGRAADAARALEAGAGGDPVREDPWQAELLAHREGWRPAFLEAVAQLDRGRVDVALPALEALHEEQPQETLIHVALHRALRMEGRADRALELLLEARELDPLQDVVHLHLAGVYRDLARRAGDVPDSDVLVLALESAERACELAPTYAPTHGMRGDVLADLGRASEATEAWLRAAELDRDAPMWHEQAALALCRGGRWGDAVPLLRRLDVLRPDAPRTLLLLSAALANSGRVEEARGPLERARSLAPDDPAIQKAWDDLAAAAAADDG